MLEGKGFNVVDDANRLPIVKEKRIITTPMDILSTLR